jgi:hypothetical protein
MNKLRLNLGCGSQLLDGYINVDKFGNPNLQLDLETLPWPWADNSVAEVQLIHVLEHLGHSTDTYLGIFQELYRICRDGAMIKVVVPHPRHDTFLHDPTHVRPITPVGLAMFSKRMNQIWEEQGSPITLLAFYLDVDFELIHTKYKPSHRWFEVYPEREVDIQKLLIESEIYNNLIEQIEMILKVVKPQTTQQTSDIKYQ